MSLTHRYHIRDFKFFQWHRRNRPSPNNEASKTKS
uniref:Uncharacterized protein n=1 Tax=Arundo donax TaxID=35708 RepID=A0A0A9FQJ0_ARUDO